jgi:hypothetical protein
MMFIQIMNDGSALVPVTDAKVTFHNSWEGTPACMCKDLGLSFLQLSNIASSYKDAAFGLSHIYIK